MEGKSNKGLIVLAIILLIGVIGLGGYIVYDKVINKDNTPETKNNEQSNQDESQKNIQEEIEHKDAAFFDDYLKYLLPSGSAGNFIRTIDNFTSDDVTLYLFFYYSGKVNSGELKAPSDNNYTYNVSKDELDSVVKKYFGDISYEIVDKGGRTGIKKISDNEYQVYWFATGWQVPSAVNTGVIYNENNVDVKYDLKDEGGSKVGALTFKLLYKDGNYIVQSIHYDE